MNIGLIACGIMGGLFFIIAVIFTSLKGKGADFISGFNSKSKEERRLYDEEKLSKDHRNMFWMYSVIFGIGAICSYFISQYLAIIAFIIWLLIFAKDVHFDDEKAFDKYKRR